MKLVWTGIFNKIEVKPKVTPTEIKSKIEEALRRSAELDARENQRGGGRHHGKALWQRPFMGRERRGREGGLVCTWNHNGRKPYHYKSVVVVHR